MYTINSRVNKNVGKKRVLAIPGNNMGNLWNVPETIAIHPVTERKEDI